MKWGEGAAECYAVEVVSRREVLAWKGGWDRGVIGSAAFHFS